jgi:hypothetical protein
MLGPDRPFILELVSSKALALFFIAPGVWTEIRLGLLEQLIPVLGNFLISD